MRKRLKNLESLERMKAASEAMGRGRGRTYRSLMKYFIFMVPGRADPTFSLQGSPETKEILTLRAGILALFMSSPASIPPESCFMKQECPPDDAARACKFRRSSRRGEIL
eukprot:16977_3